MKCLKCTYVFAEASPHRKVPKIKESLRSIKRSSECGVKETLTRCQVFETGNWKLEIRERNRLDPGCWILDTGYWIKEFCHFKKY